MEPDQLRKKILALREALSERDNRERSLNATQRLQNLSAFRNSRYPLLFISFRSEIHTHQLIKSRLEAGLPVLIPRSIVSEHRLEIFRIRDWKHDLAKGAYGILEPVPERTEKIHDPGLIDTVLVPGSVFDRHCGRYGYGGGFYDRFLEKDAPDALRIGLAFHFQLLEHIPLEPHDQRLDMIVTDREIVTCRRGSGAKQNPA